MVIRGKPRGNGKQLAHYLAVHSWKENDDIQILEVAGRLQADETYLHETMLSMSLTSELTKSDKGLYHAQINPAYSEDRGMSQNDWLEAADILGKELGLEHQRRVIVLHEKKGRMHAHVVWERYDHETGKMISDSFSRLAQDRARKEMERIFEHKQTPHRNKSRPELKDALTSFWNQTETGAEFVSMIYDNGYMVAQGVPDRPFMVVDDTGRTFDLVKQLKGVRTKEVRQRLKGEQLTPEKQAIEFMRNRKQEETGSGKSGRQKTELNPKFLQAVSSFAENRDEILNPDIDYMTKQRRHKKMDGFVTSSEDIVSSGNRTQPRNVVAEQFSMNRTDSLQTQEGKTPGVQEENLNDKATREFGENRQTDKHKITDDEEFKRLVQEQQLIREQRRRKRRRGLN